MAGWIDDDSEIIEEHDEAAPQGSSRRTLRAPEVNALRAGLHALRSRSRGVVNAAEHGVVADGTTDNASALADVIAEAKETKAELVWPAGQIATSQPLRMADAKGLKWTGRGAHSTVFVPLAGLAGQPVIDWTNCRDCSASGFGVAGRGGGAAPLASIRLHQDSESGYVEVSSRNVFRDLWLNAGGAGTTHGVVMSCRPGNDAVNDVMNDQHVFYDLFVESVTGSGYRIEHENALIQRIIGGFIYLPDIGVECRAGSFEIDDTYVIAKTVEFRIGAAGKTFHHPIRIAAKSEYAGVGTNPMILDVLATTAEVEVDLVGYRRQGSTPGKTLIDFKSPGGHLKIRSRFKLGQVGNAILVTPGAAGSFEVDHSMFPFESITYDCPTSIEKNHFLGATPVVTGPAGMLTTDGNKGINIGALNAGEPWIAAEMLNGWVAFENTVGGYGAAGFKKNGKNEVKFKGVVRDGNTALPMFPLPAGYRPKEKIGLTCTTATGNGRLDITPDGFVYLAVGSNIYATLDGLSFIAEQ